MTLPWERAWAEKPRLLRIAGRRSLNRADAEDVVQEAILRCVTHPGLDPDRLAAMLTTVTVRLCVDKLRDRVAAERAVARLPVPSQKDVESVADVAALVGEAANLVGRERAAMLARLLGLTVQEPADALGVSYKAVESALDRARRKLRAAWTATLGVLGWLRLRLRAAAPAATVATGAFLAAAVSAAVVGPGVSAGDAAAPAAKPLRPAAYGRPVPHARAVERHRAPAGRRRPGSVRARARAVPPAATAAPTVATPPIAAGPVRQEPTRAWVDGNEPLPQRAVRCASEGIDITVRPGYVAATCRGAS